MPAQPAPKTVEWLVVGGGIHGTYVARELRKAGVSREDLLIIDRHGELLTSFRRKARACGMRTLRSNYVQHIGPGPFGLKAFAESNDREEELVPTTDSQPRPTVDLFFAYAHHVIDRFDLDDLVRQATVTAMEENGSLLVETTTGRFSPARVVLAIGPGNRYRRPAWAGNQARIEHVWDSMAAPDATVRAGETVWVVGGGITAGQVGTAVAETADTVTICTRHPIREALREADPRWLNWDYIQKELQTLPPGSKARYDRLQRARNDGAMPPYLFEELEAMANVSIRHGEIDCVVPAADELLVSCGDGRSTEVDRIILATGFEPVWEHPFVRSVADALSLETGHRGLPVLDDETLAWQRETDGQSPLLVTGKLAEATVGPFAGNIPGARRAAERIVGTHPTGETETKPAEATA